MTRINEDKQAPIVSNILAKGFIPTPHEAARHIIQSEDRHRSDALNAIVSGGLTAISGAVCLSLSPMLLPMPILATAVCGATWYNSRTRQQRREQEMEFIKRHKEVFAAIDVAESQGAMPEALEAGYKSAFRAYLDDELGRTPQLQTHFEDKPLRLRDIPIDDSRIPETTANIEPQDIPESFGVQPKTETIATTVVQTTGQGQDAPQPGLPGFIAEMSHTVASGLIVGIPGAGKGLTTAMLIQHVRKYRPELRIFGIDPKNDPKESGYWLEYDKVDRFDAEPLNGWEVQPRIDAMMSEFYAAGENALLVIDEFATLMGSCDKKWVESLNTKLQKIVQMGNSRNRFVWIVSQTGNLKELKLDSSLRSSLAANLLMIVKAGSDAAIAGLIRTDLITNHNEERLRGVMERSPVKRAYYYSRFGRWESMPALPNLCGYDRDSQQWIGDAKPPEPVSKATDFPVDAIGRAVGAEPKTVPVRGLTNGGDFEAAEGSDFEAAHIIKSTPSPESEVIRYLRSVGKPRLVKQIRSGARNPVKGMGSADLRKLLAKMVDSGAVKADGSRFFVDN